MSTVAVLIPAYNAELTIERAVRSALQVDRVIVVDDGSTDDTFLRALAAHSVRKQPNAGPAEALNRAAEAATADYLLPLEADDWLEAGAVGSLKAALDAGADFAYGMTKYWGVQSYLHIPGAFDPADFYIGNHSRYAVMFRRQAWLDGIRWHTFKASYGVQDWDIVLQLVDAGLRGVFVDELVLHYVLKRSSLNGKMLAHEDALIDELRARHPKLAEGVRL